MAKILSVKILELPDKIHVGDNKSDIVVETRIEFHPLDIEHKMEYCLHLFVFDVHGKIDPPLFMSNWDESSVVSIHSSTDRKDDYLGKSSTTFKAEKNEIVVNCEITLKLGSIGRNTTYFARNLEVFATAMPAVGRISKWSKPYKTQVTY